MTTLAASISPNDLGGVTPFEVTGNLPSTDVLTCKHAGSITVIDPDTGLEVELEIMKDPASGAMLAIDVSFLEQVDFVFNSPYNDHRLQSPE